jgi:hypothetical protein
MGATRGGGGGAEPPLLLSVFTLAARTQATNIKRKSTAMQAMAFYESVAGALDDLERYRSK